jgi:predicted HTH domain antitoxin
MQVTVDIPEELQRHPERTREILEAFAIEGYRSGALTPYQTRLLLGFSTRYEFDGFLKQHQVFDHSYGIKDLEQDLKGLGL